MDVSVELHCEACGSANYSIAEGDEADAAIRCNDCGAHQGKISELQAALQQAALAQSAEALRRDLSLSGLAEEEK